MADGSLTMARGLGEGPRLHADLCPIQFGSRDRRQRRAPLRGARRVRCRVSCGDRGDRSRKSGLQHGGLVRAGRLQDEGCASKASWILPWCAARDLRRDAASRRSLERVEPRRLRKVLRNIDDPYTRLVGELADLRSDGVKDLGNADLRHEDRAPRAEAFRLRDARHPVPLLRSRSSTTSWPAPLGRSPTWVPSRAALRRRARPLHQRDRDGLRRSDRATCCRRSHVKLFGWTKPRCTPLRTIPRCTSDRFARWCRSAVMPCRT